MYKFLLKILHCFDVTLCSWPWHVNVNVPTDGFNTKKH